MATESELTLIEQVVLDGTVDKHTESGWTAVYRIGEEVLAGVLKDGEEVRLIIERKVAK